MEDSLTWVVTKPNNKPYIKSNCPWFLTRNMWFSYYFFPHSFSLFREKVPIFYAFVSNLFTKYLLGKEKFCDEKYCFGWFSWSHHHRVSHSNIHTPRRIAPTARNVCKLVGPPSHTHTHKSKKPNVTLHEYWWRSDLGLAFCLHDRMCVLSVLNCNACKNRPALNFRPWHEDLLFTPIGIGAVQFVYDFGEWKIVRASKRRTTNKP